MTITTAVSPRAEPTAPPPRARRWLLLATLVLLLLVLCAASLAVGARDIPFAVVLDALRIPQTQLTDHAVIWDNRLPRTVLGVMAGMGLAVSGALMQAITRNPLADPGLLGVNAGAQFAIVVAVAFGGLSLQGPELGGVGSVFVQVWFALAGAVVAAVGVYLVSGGGRRPADPARLTLAGVALGAVLLSAGQGLALVNPAAYDKLRAWQLGSLDVRSFDPILAILPFIVVGTLLALVLTPGLNALGMGEDLARAVGASVTRTRVLGVVALTLLAGSATAAAGAISFAGLMIPHAVRRVVGADQRWIVGLSVVAGPCLLLAADLIGRRVVAAELPVGVVTAFLGGPVLVAVARARKVRSL